VIWWLNLDAVFGSCCKPPLVLGTYRQSVAIGLGRSLGFLFDFSLLFKIIEMRTLQTEFALGYCLLRHKRVKFPHKSIKETHYPGLHVR
jgi:hypothetical protein